MALGSNLAPPWGVTSFTWAYIGKNCQISLYLAIRPRLTKFCRYFYLVSFYQECPNFSPGVKFGPTPGGHRFHIGLYRENFKNLSVPSYKALCMYLYLVSLYGECPNYSPGVKVGPTPGVTSFTWAYIRRTLEISLYLAIRPRLTKFCM